MGYYVNTLQQGASYQLNGQRLVYMQKIDGRFYFYLCKYDENWLDYIQTDELVSFSFKELNYIKRLQECSSKGSLKPIGKEKVFARN